MNISQNIKIAVDAVVFGYDNSQLKILLIQQKFGDNKNKWALPGGFVQNNETLDQAVLRELKEETAVTVNYLEQLYTFGEINRDNRARVVSVAYLALINPKNYQLKADTDAKDAQWFPINNVPELLFDHNHIIEKGIQRLQAKINYQPIGFELLDEKFPFSDLENLYQTILNKSIDRRNFRKKLLSFGILQETNELSKKTSGRPAKLFKFNKQKYNDLVNNGFHFEIKFA